MADSEVVQSEKIRDSRKLLSLKIIFKNHLTNPKSCDIMYT